MTRWMKRPKPRRLRRLSDIVKELDRLDELGWVSLPAHLSQAFDSAKSPAQVARRLEWLARHSGYGGFRLNRRGALADRRADPDAPEVLFASIWEHPLVKASVRPVPRGISQLVR